MKYAQASFNLKVLKALYWILKNSIVASTTLHAFILDKSKV